MRRGSRRGSRRPLEVDPLEDRSLLSQFGWQMTLPIPVPPASSPAAFALTQVSFPQLDHLRAPVTASLPAGPWLQGLAPGGDLSIAYNTIQTAIDAPPLPGLERAGGVSISYGTVQSITGTPTFPGRIPVSESPIGLAPEPGNGFGLAFLRDLSFPPSTFDPGRRGPGDGPEVRTVQAPTSDLTAPGGPAPGGQPIGLAPLLAPERAIPPSVVLRPDSGTAVADRLNTLTPANSAEGIAILAGMDVLVARAPASATQPVTSSLSGIFVSIGQRIFVSLVSLPMLQTGPAGPDSSAPAAPATGLPVIEASRLSVTPPLGQQEPVPAEVPSPEGADLITRFSPFDLTPLEQSFTRLLERIGSFESGQELEPNHVSPMLLIVAGIAAFEASRRWQRHRLGVGSGRSWVIRRSAIHHPI